jgi:hypothetical protein
MKSIRKTLTVLLCAGVAGAFSQVAWSFSFFGGGGSGIPTSSIDANETGSDTKCSCDEAGADCRLTLSGDAASGYSFTADGDAACKKYEGGEDPVGFFDGAALCAIDFTFSPVEVTLDDDDNPIAAELIVGTRKDNDGITAEGTISCSQADNGDLDLSVVCPDATDCTLSFGGVLELNNNQLRLNLPETDDLAEGQVLAVEITTDGSGTVTDSSTEWRLCHDRFGEFDDPRCEGVQGNKRKTTSDAYLAELVITSAEWTSPNVFNVVEPNSGSDGVIKAAIGCDGEFDPGTIQPGSLKVEGVAPLSETIPAIGNCQFGSVYEATFSRQALVAGAAANGNIIEPNSTAIFALEGFACADSSACTFGDDILRIVGTTAPIETR